MNIVQLCKALEDIEIQDIPAAITLVNRINEMHLPMEQHLDLKATGDETLKKLNSLDISKSTYACLISEVLCNDDVRTLKRELNSLKVQQAQREAVSTQSKNTTVVVLVSIAATIGISCIVIYMRTKGVDVETSSDILTAFVEVMKAVLEFAKEE